MVRCSRFVVGCSKDCAKIVVRCSRFLVRCSKDCAKIVVRFEEGYCACQKAGLKGETSNELTAGCGFEFNSMRPQS